MVMSQLRSLLNNILYCLDKFRFVEKKPFNYLFNFFYYYLLNTSLVVPINFVVLCPYNRLWYYFLLRLLSAFPSGERHFPSPVVSSLELYPPPSLQPQPRGILYIYIIIYN